MSDAAGYRCEERTIRSGKLQMCHTLCGIFGGLEMC